MLEKIQIILMAGMLASLNLPFANEWGDMFNQRWASIHSSPPWQDTDTPVIPLEAVTFALRSAPGEVFTDLTVGPQKEAHPYSIDEHGCLTATLERLTDLTMFHAAYDKAEGV